MKTSRFVSTSIALATLSMGIACAEQIDKGGYLTDSNNDIVKSGAGLCFHTGSWAPEMAIEGCDSVPLKAAVAPRAAAPAIMAAPVAAPLRVIVPVPIKTQQYCSILDIQFEINKDVIQREVTEKLAVVGTFMNKYPDTTAVIEGHTDNVGSTEDNMKLSQRRAESVVNYLVNDQHVASSRLSAVGYGETRPVADNSTLEGKQMNRRINAVIACATDVAGLTVLPARLTMALEMEFDPYKHTIEPQYLDGLAWIANYMKVNPDVTATVEGHAGKFVGKTQVSSAAAMEVSKKRAQHVVDYLVDNLNVSRSRLSAQGYGLTRRVAYGITLEGQQDDRRVNIIFNYPK